MRFRTCLTACCLLLLLSCAGGEQQRAVDRSEIEALLVTYLPLLAQAHATGDTEPLAAYAAQKEVAVIQRQIQEMREAGRVLEPTFRSVTIEELDVWNWSNAYVTTSEVWDLRLYPTGNRTLLGEEIGHVDRVKYQLKRERDGWRVLFRSRQG